MTILSRVAGELAAKATGKTVARDVVATTARTAATTLGRDVLKTTGSAAAKSTVKAAEAAANPAFDAAMSAVRSQIKTAGKYSNLSTPLLEAVSKAATTDEALQVAKLARKMAVGYNQVNRGALVAALETAAQKSKVHEEAFATLVQTVSAREEAYAIFRVTDKRKLVETVVDRYMHVGGLPAEELVGKALRLVDPVLNQNGTRSTIKRVSLMTTIADQVRTMANFINKALR